LILSIQYMRAIAAILVVVSHISVKSWTHAHYAIDWGKYGILGVDIFFIISGYIMMFIAHKKENNMKLFLKSRFIRIIPLYWILSLVSLSVYLYNPSIVNSSTGDTTILSSFLLIPGNGTFLVATGWTLTYEIYFYFLFSIALLFKSHYRYVGLMLIMILLVGYGSLFNDESLFFSDKLLEFSVGMLAYMTHKSLKIGPAIILFLFLSALLAFPSLEGKAHIIQYGISATLFFVGMIHLEPFFRKYRTVWIAIIFEKIGESSYSLYLTHLFVLGGVSRIFKLELLQAHPYLYIGTLFFGSIIVGHLCYLYLETFLIGWVRKRL